MKYFKVGKKVKYLSQLAKEAGISRQAMSKRVKLAKEAGVSQEDLEALLSTPSIQGRAFTKVIDKFKRFRVNNPNLLTDTQHNHTSIGSNSQNSLNTQPDKG